MRSRSTVWTLATLICAVACGGGHSTGPSTPHLPAKTPAGTPTGAPITTTIGPAGGVAMSDDSRMQVVVPAGALGSDVDIGVQLVTAEAPGATGPAYRLTPEGMTFNTPVNLVFQYDSVDLLGSAPELLWIASQQADGSWLLAPGVVLDAGSSTLSVPATHFSDWTRLQGLQIRPPEGRVKPGESQALLVKNCTTIVDVSTGIQSAYAIDCEDAPTTPAAPGDDELPPLPTFAVDVSSWSVNGIRGGSPTYGHVAGALHSAEFVAPTTAPTSNNPVAVSVKAHTYADKQVVQLVANIEIELVCGPQGAVRMVGASRADDVCTQDWFGTSSTVFFDANPLYRVEATVRWNYDPEGSAQAGPGISVYYPTGTAQVTPTDPCIQLSPNQLAWNKGDPGTGGGLRIDYNQTIPTYSGNGGAQWLATGTDICNQDPPQQVPVGGSYFFASGVLESPGLSRITGTNSVGGQTFTFTFERAGTAPPSRAVVRSRHR
jgi:hypothetical protein